MRIFDERELIEEEFGKIQKDNRDFIKGIGKDEGSFKAASVHASVPGYRKYTCSKEISTTSDAGSASLPLSGSDEGSFKAANSVVNTFLSGIACLYTGVNAYRELISVGNVQNASGCAVPRF